MDVEAGTLINGEIRVTQLIAKGAMGSIWRADHLRRVTPVAVKVIQRELAEKSPELVERFEREARAVAQIANDHVVRILEFGLSEGVPYMVMELLDGQTLRQWFDLTGRMSVRDTIRLVAQLASGLDEAHALGLVHRDVKPENILVLDSESDDLRVKLLDFGVAKHTRASRRITLRGVAVGTPYYMSPEQLASATDVDARADLWSLAVVAYEAMSGELPFDGESLPEVAQKVRSAAFVPITKRLKKGAPRALDGWFARALAADMAKRFATARELSAALYAAIDADDADKTVALRALDPDDLDETSSRDTFPEIAPKSGTSLVARLWQRVRGER